MTCKFLINMDDGRLELNDKIVAEQVNLKPIPDEVASMILHGEVTAKDVVNAVSAKIKESGNFNLNEYLEALKKLNVRKSNKQEAPEISAPAEVDAEDTISVADLKVAKTEEKVAKKERAKKVNAALDKAEEEEGPLEGISI